MRVTGLTCSPQSVGIVYVDYILTRNCGKCRKVVFNPFFVTSGIKIESRFIERFLGLYFVAQAPAVVELECRV